MYRHQRTGVPVLEPAFWPAPLKLSFFLVAYLGQHTPVGFTWLALPVILRGCGISLAAIGFMALLYAPWALKFLYAPLVDHFHFARMGLRKSWILPARILVIVVLGLLAFFPPHDGALPLFFLVLIMNAGLALGDIAVDGFAADILKPGERAQGAAVQMGANFTGFMVGGGVFLILYHHLGWAVCMGLLSGFLCLLSLPLFLFREGSRTNPFEETAKVVTKPSFEFIRSPRALGFLTLLALMALVMKSGYQLRFTLLGELGFSPHRIGALMLWAGSPVAVTGTWLGSLVIRKIPAGLFFSMGCAACAGVSGASWVLAKGICRTPGFTALAVGAEQLVMGLLMSAIYALILQASAGSGGAAGRFGVLCGFQHLTTFSAVILGGLLGQALGYDVFFLILTLACLACIRSVRALFAGRLGDLDRALITGRPPSI